ncbi:MAG TPA: cyclopropane-fatty-acyl-phospholipid synthase family protein [Terriglobales bacterium]|nr:cyclopropane-fatty-acyl-phospholipid synthase family protein [Terriglobales bacterium]
MAERVWKVEDLSASKTLKFLQLILEDYHPRDFTIQLWDGTEWLPEKSQFHRFTWKISNPDALRGVILSPNRQVSLAEAYVRGDFDIEGDIEAIFPLADFLIHKEWKVKGKVRLARMFAGLSASTSPPAVRDEAHLQGHPHSKSRDRQAIHYHYDVSNDFYKLWLDQNMAYSCAYFQSPDEDIDTAQLRKFDYICRKLRLTAGERLLDIGCGWGGLMLFAAQKYGVRTVGITLSEQQLEFAQARIVSMGLSDRCEVRLLDYRDLDEPAAYDKVVSVGMVEHVGESNLAEYFQQAFHMLRPGGVFLNVGIGRAGNRPIENEPAFTDVYIFPDGELESAATMLANAERAGFEVRDLENLREHYCLTAKQWLRRLEAHAKEAEAIVGEIKYRMWRLYLAGSAYYFQRGWLDLYQSLLVKNQNGHNDLPLTREDWYCGSGLGISG